MQAWREQLEQQTQQVLRAQRKLQELDGIMGNEPGFDFFAKPEAILSEHLKLLLRRRGIEESVIHKEFLAHEITSVHPEELLTWIVRSREPFPDWIEDSWCIAKTFSSVFVMMNATNL